MGPRVHISAEDLSHELVQLETLLVAVQAAESRLAELVGSSTLDTRLAKRPETAHTATDQVQGLLNKTEEMRSRIARLESSLDTLESALASIEILRIEKG